MYCFKLNVLQVVINKICYHKYPELSNDFEEVFHQLLEMLLQKQAPLRASIDEVLTLPSLQTIIKKVQSDNPGFYEEDNTYFKKQAITQHDLDSPQEGNFTFVKRGFSDYECNQYAKKEWDVKT